MHVMMVDMVVMMDGWMDVSPWKKSSSRKVAEMLNLRLDHAPADERGRSPPEANVIPFCSQAQLALSDGGDRVQGE